MIRPVKMRDKIIGESRLTLLIAEITFVHQRNVQNTYNLAKVVAEADVDAIQLKLKKKSR